MTHKRVTMFDINSSGIHLVSCPTNGEPFLLTSILGTQYLHMMLHFKNMIVLNFVIDATTHFEKIIYGDEYPFLLAC